MVIKILNKVVTIAGAGFIGYLAGVVVTKRKTKYAGVLRIDNSEKDVPERLFLELNNDLDKIEKSKVIAVKVIRKNWI